MSSDNCLAQKSSEKVFVQLSNQVVIWANFLKHLCSLSSSTYPSAFNLGM